MATLRRRGEAWQLCWYQDGIERRRSLGKIPKREAEQIRLQTEINRHHQGNVAPSFEAFAREYLNWHKHEYPDSHGRIYQIIEQHLKPVFRHVAIDAIDRRSVEQYKHDRLTSKLEPAPTTVGKELRTLQAIINKAVEWQLLPRNPIKGVKPPKDNRDAPPPFYTVEEIATIYEHALDPIKLATWMLFFNTGMRRAEGQALRKEWIDQRGIKILSTGESRTKSGKWRIVPHNEQTRAALKILNETDGQLVLPRVHAKSLSRAFDRCLYRTGEKGKNGEWIKKPLPGSIHWTRHTYASHLVMAGEPLAKVQKLLGHASIKTTERYTHLDPDYMSSVAVNL